MKYKKLIPRAAAVLLGVMLITFGTFGVLADNDDQSSANPESSQSEQVDPVTEAPQPETEEPQTEPQPETEAPQPETEAPQPETEKPEEPKTEHVETETNYEEPYYYINNGGDSNTDATQLLNAPTVPKTVSKKTYSTNYAFGAASWICAGIGIVVILAVAISTKASGRKNGGMYDRFPNR